MRQCGTITPAEARIRGITPVVADGLPTRPVGGGPVSSGYAWSLDNDYWPGYSYESYAPTYYGPGLAPAYDPAAAPYRWDGYVATTYYDDNSPTYYGYGQPVASPVLAYYDEARPRLHRHWRRH